MSIPKTQLGWLDTALLLPYAVMQVKERWWERERERERWLERERGEREREKGVREGERERGRERREKKEKILLQFSAFIFF